MSRISYAPTAINNRGLIVGHRGPAWALWNGASWRSIGSLGEYGEVTGLNGAGLIVGFRYLGHTRSATYMPTEAILWRSGHLTVLPTLGGFSSAEAINDRGQIVGYSITRAGAQRAVLWDHGRILDLSRREWKSSIATGINDRGEIIGYAFTAGDRPVPFLWRTHTTTLLAVRGAFADAINERGQVILNGVHSWLWDNGRVTELRPLAGEGPETRAVALNDRGDVVGWSGNSRESRGDVKAHAVIWTGGKIIDLGAFRSVTGWENVAINQRGDAVAANAGGPTLWSAGHRTDLGRLAPALRNGEAACEEVALNDNGVVVGAIQHFAPGPGGIGQPAYGLVWQRTP